MKYTLRPLRQNRSKADWKKELNPQQLAVVEAPAKELLVLAGAGTGKTRTLIYRIAHLIDQGCPPEQIMLVTFTNRAAREMTSRIESLLGIEMRRCHAGTFHHVANRILRRYQDSIALGHNFTLLDSEDARSMVEASMTDVGISKLTSRRFPTAKLLASIISLANGSCSGIQEVIHLRFQRFNDVVPMIEEAAQRYAKKKLDQNVCDFDDLLQMWLRLLIEPQYTNIGEHLRGSFAHILVDEFQDVNSVQGRIIDEMAIQHRSLTCVGDDAQSIYSFRGADFRQINHFVDRHPEASVLPLTINYRSSPEILSLSNRSIAFNSNQYPKELQTLRKSRGLPVVIPLRDVFQQAEFIAQRILELHHDQNIALQDIAVLYRNHAHGLEIQIELTRRKIPFSVRSGLRFFEQAHIKDVLAFLRAHHNPQDMLAWHRLLRQWPGVGSQTSEQITGFLQQHLTEQSSDTRTKTSELLRSQEPRVNTAARTALQRMAKLWDKLEKASDSNPGESIKLVLDHHYRDYSERNFPNANTRNEDISQLSTYAQGFTSTAEFLSELALIQGMTTASLDSSAIPDDHLVLSTIHQAKGLEWNTVMLVNLVDGYFPMAPSTKDPDQLEEERRLFYVAATRAKQQLYLCFPTMEEGKNGLSKMLRPSRFLGEIDQAPAVFERWDIEEQAVEDAN